MIYKSYLIEQNIEKLKEKLILFYGENLGLKNDLKKKILFKNKDAEIINFFQDEVIKNENLLFNEILNISLFDQKKIYFINQATDAILNLIQEIEKKIDTQKIFIFSEILDKRSKLRNFFEKNENCGVIPCYADNEISLKKIILDRLRDFTGLSSQNIGMIIDNVNLDRDKLNNELDKITIFFSNKIIQNEKLEVLLNTKTNDNFNTLKDEAFNGNKIKTNKLLSDTFIDSEKNILYLNLINQRLNKLLEISNLNKDTKLENAINMLKPPIFWKDKNVFMSQAKKWKSDKIKNILNETYKLEIEIKSNAMLNKNVLLKKLLIDICTLANA